MNKTVLIKQPAGLGDILFTQKIIEQYLVTDNKVLWPVIKEYEWIKDKIVKDGLVFITEDSDFIGREFYDTENTDVIVMDDFIYIPLQYADQKYPNMSLLEAKYAMAELKYDNWRNFVKLTRDFGKEFNLMENELGIGEDDKYRLVSRYYGSPPHVAVRQQIPRKHETLRTIELCPIPGYDLIDWMRVIENATEVEIVDSALNYLIDLIRWDPKQAPKLKLWSRYTPPNFFHIENLFKQPWERHYHHII